MTRFVIDASIVLAWCFADEDAAVANHVAQEFRRGRTAVAPSFWAHEVLNALLVGEKRKRISRRLVQDFLEDLAMLPVELSESPAARIFDQVQRLSREHSLTAYDAAYLHLALDMNLPLATLDEDLIRASKRAGTELVKI